jgi:hypothetical protein
MVMEVTNMSRKKYRRTDRNTEEEWKEKKQGRQSIHKKGRGRRKEATYVNNNNNCEI